jgi:SNF2 family DNA or RNA helicase
MVVKEMKHQTVSLKFMAPRKEVFDMSDPGTGKTYVQIKDFAKQHKKDKKCLLVVCPKSLMQAAWANDIKKFAPHLRVSIGWAKGRSEAFAVDADVYVINVDGVKELLKYGKPFWKKFGRLVIDESTAFKHHTSQRSKAMGKISKHFEWRRLLSGTPTSNGICDLWHQMSILDGGKRLGKSFFAFRSACCSPEQVGPSTQHLKWTDKPGIELQIATLLEDVVIRHKFEDCVDIPPCHMYSVETELNAKHFKFYKKLHDDSILILEDSSVSAMNKAVLANKLLQCASGAVYNDAASYSLIDSDRYELVMDLVEAREHSIVFYTWEHQLHELLKLAKSRKVDHVVWNPDHPHIEAEFQAGKYQVLFAHPQSAGHGLTFTKGTATIWPSPTYNLEHFRQGLKRVHRIGQKSKTEVIVIVGKDTRDEHAWDILQTKGLRMDALLGEFE